MTLRKPLPRKRATPRAWKSPRCGRRGCGQIARVFGGVENVGHAWDWQLCSKHAKAEAARLWSLLVRTGRCDLAEWHQGLDVRCGGAIVGCHGFGKGAYPSVRYEKWNGFSGCSGINQWTEDHPLEWDDFLRATWGPLYEERRKLALAVPKYDLGEVIADLSAQLAQVKRPHDHSSLDHISRSTGRGVAPRGRRREMRHARFS